MLRQALARAGTRVCEPVLRVSLEVPDRQHAGACSACSAAGARSCSARPRAATYATLEARLPAARLHELQRQLPDLTGGEGVLESRFDGYEPVRGRAAGPARVRRERVSAVPRFTRAELESFRDAEVPDLVGPGDAAAVRRHQPRA